MEFELFEEARRAALFQAGMAVVKRGKTFWTIAVSNVKQGETILGRTRLLEASTGPVGAVVADLGVL